MHAEADRDWSVISNRAKLRNQMITFLQRSNENVKKHHIMKSWVNKRGNGRIFCSLTIAAICKPAFRGRSDVIIHSGDHARHRLAV